MSVTVCDRWLSEQHTSTVQGAFAGVWDHLMFFSMQLTPEEYETGKITIRMLNSGYVTDQLIGACQRVVKAARKTICGSPSHTASFPSPPPPFKPHFALPHRRVQL